jgi:hypothetical protein
MDPVTTGIVPQALQLLAARGRLSAAQAATLPRVIIVGEGGSGKSTLLKQMLAGAAAAGKVPVWVPLAALPADGPLTVSAFIDYLVRQAQTGLGLEHVNRTFFETLARDGQVVVGFDALDESGSLARRQRVRGLIVEVAHEWARCHVYVTSRPEALHDTPLPMPAAGGVPKDENEFFGLEPMHFTRDDVAPFLRAAFEDGEQLAQVLLGRTGIEALIETPLTLTLVGLVARTSKGLPATRTPLFARVIDTVVETWEEAKGAASVADGLDRAQRLDVLRRLGWETQQAGGDELGARAASAALARPPDAMTPSRARTVINGMSRRNLLLRAETAGDGGVDVHSIRFAHPQFREYLAGACLAERFAFDATSAAADMAPHWLDSRWLEVLRFAVATLESEPPIRDAFLRAALAADDAYIDLLHRPQFLVARLLARVPGADATLVDGIVACLEKVAFDEPALRDEAAMALLALASHASALPAIERGARGEGFVRALADDERLRWRLRAIEALASARGAAAAITYLPAQHESEEHELELPALLRICELRARLGDRNGAQAMWRRCIDVRGPASRWHVAASMDKEGAGAVFNQWLLARVAADDVTVADARFAHERGLLPGDAPVWARLFERARTALEAMDPDEESAPEEVSDAVYAALEADVGVASPDGRALILAALRHRSLIWFVGPRAGKAMPEVAAEAVQRLAAYVLDERNLRLRSRAHDSRRNVALHALCEEPDDALAIPALLELLRRFDPGAYWAKEVADSLQRRGQVEAGLAALEPRLGLPPGIHDREPDQDAAARREAWQLARTLDVPRMARMLDARYRAGDPQGDAERLMRVWNVSGVAPVARDWFAILASDDSDQRAHSFLKTLTTHERDTGFTDEARHALYGSVFDDRDKSDRPARWTLADYERAFAHALDDGWFVDERDNEKRATTRELIRLLSSIATLADPAIVLRHADTWVQRCLADAVSSPDDKTSVLSDCLEALASRGLRDVRWMAPVASFARTLTPSARAGLVIWLNANA